MNIRVGIIGLGLIGGSIGMALRCSAIAGGDAAGECTWSVTGYDLEHRVMSRAFELGAVDTTAGSVGEMMQQVDVAVVAVPTSGIASLVLEAAQSATPGTLITDCGSVKSPLVGALSQELPRSVEFVAGHPMAGSERSGIDAATPELFRGARWALIQAADSQPSPHAGWLLEAMIRAVGASPFWIDATSHDHAVAFTSHLSYVVSLAFALACSHQAGTNEAVSQLAARSFRDLTRVARALPEAPLDYCTMNQAPLLAAIDSLCEQLDLLRSALAGNDSQRLLSLAGRAREFLVKVDQLSSRVSE